MNPNKSLVGKSIPTVRPSNQPAVSAPQNLPRVPAGEILPEEIFPLRLKEVAQRTKRSQKTVWRWIQAGLLRSHKLGGLRVIQQRDLRTFLDQQAGAKNKECA